MFDLPTYADALLRGVVLSALTLGWIVVMVNIVGLRAFSKMTSFDFVTTVAFGSLLATAATMSEWPAFLQTVIAIGVLFFLQYLISRFRKDSDSFESFIANSPLLLMKDGEIIQDALKKGRVSHDDLVAKLREANVMHFSEVRAVVLESTGDISVLHGKELDNELLCNVKTI